MYLSGMRKSRSASEEQWPEFAQTCLIQFLQHRKQHHVHLPTATGVRVPLTSCRKKDKPNEWKSNFPQDSRMIVVCPGLARRLKMPWQERLYKVGMLHGPQ